MRIHVYLLLLATMITPARAQDIIYYKFESGGGNTVINYADDTPVAQREGAIVTASGVTTSQAWGSGRYGGGLAAGPLFATNGAMVETGWNNAVSGDLTVGMYLHLVHSLPGTSSPTFAGANFGQNQAAGIVMNLVGTSSPNFGRVLLRWQANQGSPTGQTYLTQNLVPQLMSGWVHVAIVIKRTAPPYYARWFLNGTPLTAQSINLSDYQDIPPQFYGSTEKSFTVGAATGSAYLAIDEFRVSLREVSSTEIAEWATRSSAAHARFGEACHPFGTIALLDGTSGGLPLLGNTAYSLNVYGLPQTSVLLGIGLSNQSFAGQQLPLDLGAFFPALQGCMLRSSADLLAVPLQIGPAGAASVTLPIPPDPVLEGLVLYSQAYLNSPILSTDMLTNAWASSLGN